MKASLIPVGFALLLGIHHPSQAAEHLVGGYAEASATNTEVVAAAQFSVKALAAMPERMPVITLVEILFASQQVVAGMNYRLRLKVKVDGKDRDVEVVVWRKLDGEYQLTSRVWNQPTASMAIGTKQYAPPNNPLSRPIDWTNAYGFLIKWQERKTPEFFIYRQIPPSIRHVTMLDEFFSGLGEIPDGSTLDWVNTCCCPISSGLPKTAYTRLEQLVQEHRFVLLKPGEGATLVCTCESTNIVWFTETSDLAATIPAQLEPLHVTIPRGFTAVTETQKALVERVQRLTRGMSAVDVKKHLGHPAEESPNLLFYHLAEDGSGGHYVTVRLGFDQRGLATAELGFGHVSIERNAAE